MDSRFYTVVQVKFNSAIMHDNQQNVLVFHYCFPLQVWDGIKMVHKGRDQNKVLEWVSKVSLSPKLQQECVAFG